MPSTSPIDRRRADVTNIITTFNETVHRSTGREFVGGFSSREAADAYRPSWWGNPWFPAPPLDRAVEVGRKMNDVIIPGVKKRIAEGEVIPTNPMTSWSMTGDSQLGTMGYVGREVWKDGRYWRTVWCATQVFVRPSFRQPAMPAHDLKRLTAARAKMQEGYTDLLTFVAEFHKTVELVVKFRQRVLLALEDLIVAWSKRHKKPFLTYAAALESLSSFWLEARFGWRILLYDYEGIVAAINDLDGKALRRPFRDRRYSEIPSTNRYVASNTPETGRFVVRSDTVETLTFSGGCLGDARLSVVSIDPITTAWELLTLTLVLDMFWNVGDYLKAISPFGMVTEVDAWTSVHAAYSETKSFEWVPPTNPAVEIMKSLPPTGTAYVLSRTSRIPQEKGANSLGVQINLSPSKLLDVLAIGIILRKLVMRRVKFLTGVSDPLPQWKPPEFNYRPPRTKNLPPIAWK